MNDFVCRADGGLRATVDVQSAAHNTRIAFHDGRMLHIHLARRLTEFNWLHQLQAKSHEQPYECRCMRFSASWGGRKYRKKLANELNARRALQPHVAAVTVHARYGA